MDIITIDKFALVTQLLERQYGSWWDPYSNQPYKIGAAEKPRLGAANLAEYLKVFATAILASPVIALRYAGLRTTENPISAKEFVGLSISPNAEHNAAIVELVEELGVEELLLRVPAWDTDNIQIYLDFAGQFKNKRFLINILQNRDSVREPQQWRHNVNEIYTAFEPISQRFQIGNAINRSKWGCAHSGEYLRLLKIAHDVKTNYPNIELLGSSVIDFEPLITLRTLFNFHRFRVDGCAAQLYINRRGSAFGKQYGYFDLERKLRLIYALVALSNRSKRRLWITETNWPLLNTKPYTPNSGHPRSTVDEETQAKYLTQYYRIAYQSGWVEKVYWWQLINPGYGLIDHRGGELRKMPSFFAFQSLLNNPLNLNITP